jgi:hypothetical protein
VTCRIVIVGLILLAVFLPLAMPAVVDFVLAAPVAVDDATSFVPLNAQSIAFLAVPFLRGPPSR